MSDWINAKARFLSKYPSAKLHGPSGDGSHIAVDGKWMGYGNIPENAWIDADRNSSAVRSETE